eukprot:4622931-Lingulodinium_polyedra.AAC.1
MASRLGGSVNRQCCLCGWLAGVHRRGAAASCWHASISGTLSRASLGRLWTPWSPGGHCAS